MLNLYIIYLYFTYFFFFFFLVAHLKEVFPGPWSGEGDKCNFSLLGIDTQQLRTEFNT